MPTGNYAGIKKNHLSKTYFFLNDKNKEITVTSYFMKSGFAKKEKASTTTPPKRIGEGAHAEIFLKYNFNSGIVKKILSRKNTDAFNPCRLAAYRRLHLDKNFRKDLKSCVCIPFQIEKQPSILYMEKITGASLEDLSQNGKEDIELTKFQIMTLLHVITRLAHEFSIVHGDIHAGNIMLNFDNNLILIDFDECISRLSLLPKKQIENDEYMEDPTDEDYLGGYDGNTPKYLYEHDLDNNESVFYLEENTYRYEFEKSIRKYKAMFHFKNQPLFDSEEFRNTSELDKSTKFCVTIKTRDTSNDSEESNRDY